MAMIFLQLRKLTDDFLFSTVNQKHDFGQSMLKPF